MTADEFTAAMLAEIRRDFYRGEVGKRYFWDEPMLLQAIALPARWMNDHHVQASASKYREILRGVLGKIKEHGNRAAIHSFGRYFLHAVQTHMDHHGEDYYDQAKALRTQVNRATADLRRQQSQDAIAITTALDATHRILSRRSGRQRAIQKTGNRTEPDLFTSKSVPIRSTSPK